MVDCALVVDSVAGEVAAIGHFSPTMPISTRQRCQPLLK